MFSIFNNTNDAFMALDRSGMYDQHVAQIDALQREIIRLNNELESIKKKALDIEVSDPIFLKPLSEINKNYVK